MHFSFKYNGESISCSVNRSWRFDISEDVQERVSFCGKWFPWIAYLFLFQAFVGEIKPYSTLRPKCALTSSTRFTSPSLSVRRVRHVLTQYWPIPQGSYHLPCCKCLLRNEYALHPESVLTSSSRFTSLYLLQALVYEMNTLNNGSVLTSSSRLSLCGEYAK